MLPLLASIDPTRKAVQALVVVPSRELGLQVQPIIAPCPQRILG
jgi:superfamily II DNA/RNA helicase